MTLPPLPLATCQAMPATFHAYVRRKIDVCRDGFPGLLRLQQFKQPFGMVFRGTSSDVLRKTISRPIRPSSDPVDCLIEDAMAWLAQHRFEVSGSEQLHAAWLCARDIIGHVLEIEDPVFYQHNPSLIAWDPARGPYPLSAEEVWNETTLRQWVESRAEWRQALERYCAARRREALKAHVARPVEVEGCGKRRAL